MWNHEEPRGSAGLKPQTEQSLRRMTAVNTNVEMTSVWQSVGEGEHFKPGRSTAAHIQEEEEEGGVWAPP